MSTPLILASNNLHKLQELHALFAPLGFDLVRQSDLHILEVDEPHATFIENALEKARHASVASGLPALADDSGLCVRALKSAPGVHSARYAQMHGGRKTDAANNALLLKNMLALEERSAHFYCALVAVRSADDPEPLIAEGRLHGSILTLPQGSGGFGYDPLLYLPEQDCSVAQLSPEQKNSISHRAQAAQQLQALMRALWL